ncbi:hypothetical protein BJV82DRAFT_663056 [Fennellomyces sp. T-0311]|nr:hypothetical protein BJV82DRAFT_663056 [Fennellomyces sp. T-0311]
MAITTTTEPFIVRPPPRSSSLRRPSNSTTPRAGWLSKLSSAYTMGKHRWQTRFFVLVDTELRYYKNEHTEMPSCVIDLHDVCQAVIITSSSGRPYCFRLEPVIRQGNRPLTIACHSQEELSSWIVAIRSILSKLKQPYRKRRSVSSTPFAYDNDNDNDDEDEESLSRRRGVFIPPLMVHPLDELPTTVMVQSPPLSDTSTEEEVEAELAFLAEQRQNAITNGDRRKFSTCSPTFLLYQERFHLYN